jgi:hypothetical protein
MQLSLCQGYLKKNNSKPKTMATAQPQTRFPFDPIAMGY